MAARPATRRSPTDGPIAEPARPRPPTAGRGPIDRVGRPDRVRLRLQPLDDAGSTDDLPPADRTWLAESRATLREGFGDDARSLQRRAVHVARRARGRSPRGDRCGVVHAARSRARRPRRSCDTIVGDDLRDPDIRATAERAIARRRGRDRASWPHRGGHPPRPRVRGLGGLDLPRAAHGRSSPATHVLAAWLRAVPGDRAAGRRR